MPSEWKCFIKKKKKNQSHLPKSRLQPQNWRSTDLHKLIIYQQTLLITSQQQRISVLNKIWGNLVQARVVSFARTLTRTGRNRHTSKYIVVVLLFKISFGASNQ